MDMAVPGGKARPATPARIYDYLLGGIHNFPADQEAGRRLIELSADTRTIAQVNRAFLGRAVRYLAGAGIRQFLDIGSGIPTQGNVHEIAQRLAPDSRVVYVDIDPVAVAESLDILAGNPNATAILGDVRNPGQILGHASVRRLLDLTQPTALLLVAVLHFISDDDRPHAAVAELVDALPVGGYLALSHGTTEVHAPESNGNLVTTDLYKRQAATAVQTRTRPEVERFFTGLDLVEPGLVWLSEWRPDPEAPGPFAATPERSLVRAGVAVKRTRTAG
ncbi:MAG: SAM-dependent methyltransferase [Micromonosporaceae bacterium]|nr:SAM-dependent methyltransferase [Micromonosporaceae bacterium]